MARRSYAEMFNAVNRGEKLSNEEGGANEEEYLKRQAREQRASKLPPLPTNTSSDITQGAIERKTFDASLRGGKKIDTTKRMATESNFPDVNLGDVAEKAGSMDKPFSTVNDPKKKKNVKAVLNATRTNSYDFARRD